MPASRRPHPAAPAIRHATAAEPVVHDLGEHLRRAVADPDRARRGAAVAHDVGDAFADGPGHQGVGDRRQRQLLGLEPDVDPGRAGVRRSRRQLRAQRRLPEPADGLADGRHRLAGDAFDIGDLGRARAGSSGSSRPASSLLSVISDRLWPSVSCRSRAIRDRSSATASRASSCRASSSAWLVRWSAPTRVDRGTRSSRC